MTEFLLFRHGETDWNRAGRMQGSADIPLNELGLRQAAELAGFFRKFKQSRLESGASHWPARVTDILVSSPLGRAQATARLALDLHQTTELVIEKRFAETHMGQAEGLTFDDICKNFGEESWKSWIELSERSWHARFPDGESKGEVRDRALAALSELARRAGSNLWIISTHGGLIRRLLHHFHPNERVAIDVPNGSVFRLTCHNQAGTNWEVEKTPVFVPTLR